jgi:hypothetical protein
MEYLKGRSDLWPAARIRLKMNKLEGSEVTKLNSESQERLLSLLGLNIGTDDEWTIPNTIYVPRMFMI